MGAAGAAGGGGGGAEAAAGGGVGTTVWLRAGTASLGSSVELAISSRREVAASSLARDKGQHGPGPFLGEASGAVPLDEGRKVVHVAGGSHGWEELAQGS